MPPLVPWLHSWILGLDFLLGPGPAVLPAASLSFATLCVDVLYSYLSLEMNLPSNTPVLFSSMSPCTFKILLL